jgi:hypothetical protein
MSSGEEIRVQLPLSLFEIMTGFSIPEEKNSWMESGVSFVETTNLV